MEIWKPLPGLEQFYEVSTFGRVKSIPNGTKRKGRILSVPRTGNSAGYLNYKLSTNGKVTTWMIHRLVALTFIPNTNNLREINHKDGDKKNNNVENLEWVTSSQNKRHAFRTGLNKVGSEHGNSKLTESEVSIIKGLLERKHNKELKITDQEIASKFGVSRRNIGFIKKGITWCHV